MTVSIFPVGHYTGLRTADGSTLHTVRAGWQQHRLEEDAFGTWVLAHRLRETDLLGQLAGAAGQVQQLTGLGLLASADDGESFARGHRIGVMFVGLGNSPERLDEYAVGLPGLGTAAILDAGSYQLWQCGSVAPTLWDVCGLRSPDRPADALNDVLGDLRNLLANGCAYLDVAAAT